MDGTTGTVIFDPDKLTIKEYRRKRQAEAEEKVGLETYRGKPTLIREGRRINLYANIANAQDVNLALTYDAEGIGLFGSEFLYLESLDYPTEEVQFEAYKTVAERMDGRMVIIRTLDIGADKQADYFKLPPEANPALGMRGIRICLTRPDIFKTQLRAIYRASAYGKIGVMLPMIASVGEVIRAKAIACEVRSELLAEKADFDESIQFGIMIETPASVIISDLLAKEVDFFSIGTNDLTQYTLAVDRQNSSLSEFCNIHHEAIIRMIRHAVENAHANGIWVGICGELAADPVLTEEFIRMGVGELSVSPSSILALRKHICEL